MTVGGFTLISRLTGFTRDILIAALLGAGPVGDAFFVAFKLPNFFRRLFAEGAFAQGFVPVLTQYHERGNKAALRQLIDYAAGNLLCVLVPFTVFAVIAAPLVVLLFAPGFWDDPRRLGLTGELLRLTFPYLLLISLVAFCGSVLNVHRRFAVPAVTPVWLNVSLIGAALLLPPLLDEPILALGWGVLIAGIVQLLFQLPFLGQLGVLPRPRINWRHAGVRRILWLMGPALFGASATQLNLLLDTWIASFLQYGSVSWLYFADRVVELPVGVFGVALGTVLLPRLSRLYTRDDGVGFSGALDGALRLALLICLPASAGLYLLDELLIATLFGHGAFAAWDIRLTALALQAYASGLAAFMFIKLLAPAYFSRQDTRTPVRYALIALVVNLTLNLVLMQVLGHIGLALATAAAAWVNVYLLARGLIRLGVYQPLPGWGLLFSRAALATVVMALAIVVAMALWAGAGDLELAWEPLQMFLTQDWSQQLWFGTAGWLRWLLLLGLVGLGALVYGSILFAVGLRPAQLLGGLRARA